MSDEIVPTPAVKTKTVVQKPSIGRVVLVNHGTADPCVAFISKVWSDTCVNLIVFAEGGSYSSQISASMGAEIGQWSWPPRI